jgi:hypothetical protein
MSNLKENNLLVGLILQMLILMFVAIYMKIDDIPSKVADCTLEIRPEILQ